MVTLPDYQGIGIGKRFMSMIGDKFLNENNRFIITTSQVALSNSLKKDKRWICTRKGRCGSGSGIMQNKFIKGSTSSNKYTYSYEYILN